MACGEGGGKLRRQQNRHCPSEAIDDDLCGTAAPEDGFAPVHTAGNPLLTDACSLVSSCQENDEAPPASGAKPCELH